ncbi:hypothetical protein Daura_08210 [Dactylosporangium aurantiacum]|uniref:Lipoprotein n=1 Tax=Dactylosporangium aurantiacum TaxID=35754 RepID=A0A9Q9MGY9_9ACTN|nr:hypothetical protein [Dactylosporangium aurantiacum]MDG6104542.1 hypothetical protein [Dactylosporangium aurantiacum]UWZ56154.1 hypothetical protein Daura_08210 [Dactylosporangium aurantiacum]
MDHRLSRRGLFVGSAALLASALGGCEGTPLAAPTSAPTLRPPDGTPLAVWELTGGLVGTAMLALRPPRLVVFGDGDAIADAAYRSRLDADELRSLTDGLLDDLRSSDVQKQRTVPSPVAGAPVTKISVWSPAGMLTFTAEGLDEFKAEHVYADVFYDARDRLAAVHKTVSATAQPYLADRVRLVAMPVDGEPATVGTWPVDVALPEPDRGALRRADLSGDAARAVVRTLTRDLDQRGAWPAYRTAAGDIVRASWRYLLPNE